MVAEAKIQRQRADERDGLENPSPLKKKKLYRMYSYLGKKLGENKNEKRNFLTYAFNASRIMNEPGIKKQVRRHWNRLQEEMARPVRRQPADPSVVSGPDEE